MHPVLLDLGVFRIYTYGVLIALGGVLAVTFWHFKREAMGLKDEDDLWLLVNILIVSGAVGGRLLFLFEDEGIHNPHFRAAAFSFNRGFALMGAVTLVLLSLYAFCRWKKIAFLRLGDYICAAAPLWQFVGRLGCFSAGCCYGVPTNVPWAVTFTDPRSMVNPFYLGRPIHPTQLYEGFGDLLIAIGLYFLVLRRIEKKELPRGMVCVFYFAAYAVLRFVVEFYRGDTTMLPIGLTVAQTFCLGLLALSAALYFWIRRREAA